VASAKTMSVAALMAAGGIAGSSQDSTGDGPDSGYDEHLFEGGRTEPTVPAAAYGMTGEVDEVCRPC
jgi:hypothetical protein